MNIDWDVFFLKTNLMLEKEMLSTSIWFRKFLRIFTAICVALAALSGALAYSIPTQSLTYIPYIFGTIIGVCVLNMISVHLSIKKSNKIIKRLEDLLFERKS